MRGTPRGSNGAPRQGSVTILAALAGTPPLSRQVVDREALERLRGMIGEASGTVFALSTSGLMAEFDNPADALACALRMQAASDGAACRIALASEDVAADEGGAAVSAIGLAQRLRQLAPPGGIAMPPSLHEGLRNTLTLPVTPVGDPVVAMTVAAEACLGWRHQPMRRPVRASRRLTAETRIGLALIPFSFADPEAGPLAEAATNDVIRLLSGLSNWLAVSRASHMPIDLRRVRQVTGARYVLHGSAERFGDRPRLTVELNEADTGRVLWSDRFDGGGEGDEALRDSASPRVAGAVPPILARRELDRTTAEPVERLTAQDLALRAMAAIMQPERATFQEVPAMLEKALSAPGSHAQAHFATVVWPLMAIAQGWSDDPRRDAQRAIEATANLDRGEPSSRALLAYMQSLLHRDHALASTLLDRAIDEAPFSPTAWTLKARVLAQMGEGEEAIVHAEQAEAMPALGIDRAWRSQATAMAYYVGERYAEAAHWARVSAMHHPGLATNARMLAVSLVVLGRLDEAQQAARRVLAIDPGFRIGAWRLRTLFTAEIRERYAQRLRLAGLPE